VYLGDRFYLNYYSSPRFYNFFVILYFIYIYSASLGRRRDLLICQSTLLPAIPLHKVHLSMANRQSAIRSERSKDLSVRY
jgi:hypothetical protein